MVANFSLTSMFQTEQREEDEPVFLSLMLSEADKKLQAASPPTHIFFVHFLSRCWSMFLMTVINQENERFTLQY